MLQSFSLMGTEAFLICKLRRRSQRTPLSAAQNLVSKVPWYKTFTRQLIKSLFFCGLKLCFRDSRHHFRNWNRTKRKLRLSMTHFLHQRSYWWNRVTVHIFASSPTFQSWLIFHLPSYLTRRRHFIKKYLVQFRRLLSSPIKIPDWYILPT